MNTLAHARAESIPLASASKALAINRSTFYARARRAAENSPPRRSRKDVQQPRALTVAERQSVLAVLHSEECRDQPPAEVYQRLLERGIYLCSVSSMHRLLREEKENGDRHDQRVAKHHAVPRLLAEAPNEVWTWDCSKLATRARGVYLTLYVVLDLFSRFVLAWMVSRKENSPLARQLMSEAAIRYRIDPGQLTINQDRGAPMIAHRYIDQMVDLGIVLSHSRPRVSNDNAFSEAQFKTQKYQPDYPGQFANTAHARAWCSDYYDWYNFSHHHSGLARFTPEQVFTGRYHQIATEKQRALDERYAQTPERFTAGRPKVPLPPPRVEINPISPADWEVGATDTVNFPTLSRVVKAQAKKELSLD